jgi:hypothetical protein
VARIARLVAWIFALFLLWEVFVGTTQSTELVAGAIAAVITSVFVEVLRAHGLLAFRGSGSIVARAWSVPGHVVFDFFLVFWILLRSLAARRRVRGQWLTVDFQHADGARGRFECALTVALENETANGLVVDFGEGTALLHALDIRPTTGHSIL